jgi:hypothetical protein
VALLLVVSAVRAEKEDPVRRAATAAAAAGLTQITVLPRAESAVRAELAVTAVMELPAAQGDPEETAGAAPYCWATVG